MITTENSITTGTDLTTEPVTTTEETTATNPPVTMPIPPTEATTPVPDVYEVADYSIEHKDFSKLYEFEDFKPISGEITDLPAGYSGSGTLACSGMGACAVLDIAVPSDQHYSFTLRASSDAGAEGSIVCEGSNLSQSFEIEPSEGFVSLKFDNIYLSAGAHTLVLGDFDGRAYLDCVLIESSTSAEDLEYDVGTKPVNESPLRAAKNLYKYLSGLYGDKTLSAQQCSQGSNAEIDAVYNAIGKYPAIRFGELMGYSSGDDSGDIELALDWAEDGGIVGYSWYWEMGGSLYLENGFDLKKAVTDLDIASMDGGALNERYKAGDISTETLMVIDGIDLVAIQLKRLRDEKIPVLFRPLPEAGNGLFWWGQDAESYLWLYRLIFDRLDFYHGLDNLIFIWNGEDEAFYPGDDYADIVSYDLYYPEGYDGSRSGVEFMLEAQRISSKPAAISECAELPSPDQMSRDNCRWLFCSVFSGIYSELDGELSEMFMPAYDWDIFYSADTVITKDEIDY